MSVLSDNLKKARKAIDGLSQDRASKLLSVKRSTLGAWEEGRSMPPATKIPAIVKLYSITDWAGFLLNENFDPKKQSTSAQRNISFFEEKFQKLPKKLKRVAEELLNCA